MTQHRRPHCDFEKNLLCGFTGINPEDSEPYSWNGKKLVHTIDNPYNEYCMPEPIQKMINWYRNGDYKTELITAWCVKYIVCSEYHMSKLQHDCTDENKQKEMISNRLEQNAIDKTHWYKQIYPDTSTSRRLEESTDLSNLNLI